MEGIAYTKGMYDTPPAWLGVGKAGRQGLMGACGGDAGGERSWTNIQLLVYLHRWCRDTSRGRPRTWLL